MILQRIKAIDKRVNNIKEMSNNLFNKSLQWNIYKTYSNLWDIRIGLYRCIQVKNYIY